MSSDSQKTLLPKDVRDALEALGNETPPGEREFSARLHRRLVAAGAPPTPGWLERLKGGGAELWWESAQKRALLMGALLGALATATAFMILSGGRPLREGAAVGLPDDVSAEVDLPRGGPQERKAQRAVGDRRPTRDRLGQDIGAERPERPRGHEQGSRSER